MTSFEIELGTGRYYEALRLREQVLRAPLGLTLTPGDLARDSECFHLGIHAGAELLAVLLFERIDAERLKMRQVAVSPPFQRTGVGTHLLAFAESFARKQGYRTVFAHARESAMGFYEKLGYVASGESFLENTIPHRLVTKAL